MFNEQQIFSLVRQVLFLGAGFIVSKGWFSAETAEVVVGTVAAAATSWWALKTRTQKNIVSQAGTIVKVAPVEQAKVGIVNPTTPVK